MNVILASLSEWETVLPLTFTKPLGELRMGILTFRERWEKLLNGQFSYLSQDYLSEKFPIHSTDDNLFLNPAFFPTNELIAQLKALPFGKEITFNGIRLAYRGKTFEEKPTQTFEWKESLIYIHRPYHLFQYNEKALEFDFELITTGRKSKPISETNRCVSPENIFIEEGAKVEFSVLNASTGYIYVGKNAEIMEGCLIRGGLALCENAKLNMGTKIYGATTVGPWSKVGGEVNNSIFTAYSNKGHEGFLGNSVLGEWCNLGADTNNSNLKNNYSKVKLWSYKTHHFEETGLQFCGLIMGDHAKAAINTQFNTGTVVEPFANVFKSGFPSNRVEAFSWGGHHGDEKFRLDAAYDVADKMMKRRNVEFTNADKRIVQYLFEKL